MAHVTFPKPVKAVKKPNRTVSKARAAKRRKSEAVKRDVYALVDARDEGRCRACKSQRDCMHHHHIVFRSQGGQHTTENVVLLCHNCHNDAHRRWLTIGGINANEVLYFSDHTELRTWGSPCPS